MKALQCSICGASYTPPDTRCDCTRDHPIDPELVTLDVQVTALDVRNVGRALIDAGLEPSHRNNTAVLAFAALNFMARGMTEDAFVNTARTIYQQLREAQADARTNRRHDP